MNFGLTLGMPGVNMVHSILCSWAMKTAFPRCPDHGDWKALYQAAILENSSARRLREITAFSASETSRGRAWVFVSGTLEEKDALEDALYALRAFRTAWEHTEGTKAA